MPQRHNFEMDAGIKFSEKDDIGPFGNRCAPDMQMTLIIMANGAGGAAI